jgi:hypothetical protein
MTRGKGSKRRPHGPGRPQHTAQTHTAAHDQEPKSRDLADVEVRLRASVDFHAANQGQASTSSRLADVNVHVAQLAVSAAKSLRPLLVQACG